MTISQIDSKNTLSNDKNLDLPKVKVFADDKNNVNEKLKFVLWRAKNIVRK